MDIRDRLTVDPEFERAGLEVGRCRLDVGKRDSDGDRELDFALMLRAPEGWPGGTVRLQIYDRDSLLAKSLYVDVVRTLRDGEIQLTSSGYVRQCRAVDLVYEAD